MPTDPERTSPRRFERLLTEALASAGHAEEVHFELADLSTLADSRRQHGAAWEMPGHLARCPLCLEAFQVLLEGAPAPATSVIERFVALRDEPPASSPKIVAFPARWKTVFRVAAAVAVLVGAAGLFQHLARRTSAHVSAGTITLPGGRVLPRGAAIPGGVMVTAAAHTSASLADGSQLELGQDSHVSFRESFGGGTTMGLTAGEVVASVAKQTKGREFVVATPLGQVTVVGTRFSVTCQAEDVVVYQSDAGRAETQPRPDVVRAVRVTVFEGVVRVSRLREQVRLTANQAAVLREGEPGIDVSEVKR